MDTTFWFTHACDLQVISGSAGHVTSVPVLVTSAGGCHGYVGSVSSYVSLWTFVHL